jgi:hypothetical protein
MGTFLVLTRDWRGLTRLWLLGSLAVTAPALGGPTPTKTFQNAPYHYSVALPAGCRHEEGPGTLDAVCSPEFDPDKSQAAAAAASLLFEVGVEPVPQDAEKSGQELASRYSEANFTDELPEAICGEADKSRVKISNVKKVLEGGRVVYTADVACAEIKFLGVGERGAMAEFLITPGLRYRLLARAPKEDFEQNRASIDAFFASFRTLPAEPQNP